MYPIQAQAFLDEDSSPGECKMEVSVAKSQLFQIISNAF
jgi:hypothetical protein